MPTKKGKLFIDKDGAEVPIKRRDIKIFAGETPHTPEKGERIIVGFGKHPTGQLASLALFKGSLPRIIGAIPVGSKTHEQSEIILYSPREIPLSEKEFSGLLRTVFHEVELTLAPPPKPITQDTTFTITDVRPRK